MTGERVGVGQIGLVRGRVRVSVRARVRVRVRVRVREPNLQLYRALEELERDVVLLLQREAVADDAARVGRGTVEVDRSLCQVAQRHLIRDSVRDRVRVRVRVRVRARVRVRVRVSRTAAPRA